MTDHDQHSATDSDTRELSGTTPSTHASDDPATLKTLREEKVMKVWREASRLFSGMRYGVSHPIDAWFQTKRQFGDTITSSKKLRYWKKLRVLTDPLDDAELDYIRSLASNRFDFASAVFRMNAITSVTIPISAAVVANQLYPGAVQKLLSEDTGALVVVFLLLLFVLAAIFGNVFKARELRMALDIEAARRRFHRQELDDHRSTSSEEFDLHLPMS